jgi:biopolymer transport protein ExbB
MHRFLLILLLLVTALHGEDAAGAPWWDKKWPIRKKLTLDLSDKGALIKEDIGTALLLVRLHGGNFNFLGCKEDGSDMRFTLDDHKTLLKHHVEKWDGLLNEALVWVQVPAIKPAAATDIYLYCGNPEGSNAGDAKACYDAAATSAAYHFSDANDATGNSGALENAGQPNSASLIAGGLRVLGQAAVNVPDSPNNAWPAGSALTWSAWVKPTALQPTATVYQRGTFTVSIDNGVPAVSIGTQRSSAGQPITPAQWTHVAVVADTGKTTLYVNGAEYGNIATPLPATTGPGAIGKGSTGSGLVGEIDELTIDSVARTPGWIKLAAYSQGTSPESQKIIIVGADEQAEVHKPGLVEEHIHLIGDISKDLTPDGWAVIGACTLLAIIGGFVAMGKLLYLNKISKASAAFMKQWEKVADDLTVLDDADDDSIKSLGGAAKGGKTQRLMQQSPLYQIYHLGCIEVRKRMKPSKKKAADKDSQETPTTEPPERGLSGRSIQAIKATLHGGLMREVQKLNSKLVFLTIGIAGGPYLGLLGTVIGVMITFAVIAKSGQVEVNSIAPGIAGALLATVAGLAVAIPCLFAYSYIATLIKDVVTDMESFIDEFVAKMAEHYKE